MEHRPPFNVDTLADRWLCSAATIRELCRRGVLRHFKVGNMVRIPVDVVEEYEACPNTRSADSDQASASTGMKRTGDAEGFVFRLARSRKPRVKPET